MQDISKLRKSYERAELSETDSAADPFKQFEAWLQEAISAELPEPNAMTLATVGSDMRPSSRIVLIKGLMHAALFGSPITTAVKASNWLATHLPVCSSIGSSSSAWCASKAGW